MTFECIEHAAQAVAEDILGSAAGDIYIARPASRTGFINLIRNAIAREGRLSLDGKKDQLSLALTGERFGEDLYVHLEYSDGTGRNIYMNIVPE